MSSAIRMLLLSWAFLFGAAQGGPQDPANTGVPPEPVVAGKGYILIDHNTGKVLAERNADLMSEPASITKVMTAYVAFKALRNGEVSLEDEVPISKRAWYMRGSRMYIKGGQKVRFEDLLKGAIIRSGNDAATAIAEHVGGSVEDFVERMNAEAERLHMVNTRFASPSGLTRNKEFTSARDIARLSSQLIREFPEYYHWFGERVFRYSKYTLRNRNQLLADDDVDGIKTGFTNNAGYCLTASITDSQTRFIAVVMGAQTWRIRNKAVRTLLDYGKKHYETVKLYPAGQTLVNRRVWKSEEGQVGVGLEDDILVTLPRGQSDRLKARLTVDSYLMAPIEVGEKLGSVKIELDGEKLLTRPVVALESVPEGGLWRQLVDTVALWFEPSPLDGPVAPGRQHEASRHAVLKTQNVSATQVALIQR